MLKEPLLTKEKFVYNVKEVYSWPNTSIDTTVENVTYP